MKRLSFITLLILLTSVAVYSNEYSQQNNKFGIFGTYNYNLHSADFYKLNGIPNCCPNFESGTGSGLNFGLLYQRRLFNKLWLSGNIGYVNQSGTLIKEEPTTVIIETGPTAGAFEHEMIGDITNFAFELSLDYNLFSGLYLSAGSSFGYNISSTFEQSETITQPYGYGTFVDEDGNNTFSSTRNEFSGDIPDAMSLHIHALGRIYYELPLNKNGDLLLAPQLTYYFPINEIVENTSWKINSISAGLSVKYAPIEKAAKKEIYEDIYEIDTIRIEDEIIASAQYSKGIENTRIEIKETEELIITYNYIKRTDTLKTPKQYNLDGIITAVGVDESGNEIPNPVFTIEEFVSNRLDPLLNYIFFDENSSEIPSRYKLLRNDETKGFDINNLYRESTIEIYRNILNIVGDRMLNNPRAKVTLVGCNSNINDEKGNLELSESRVKAIKEYLIETWKIKETRIKIETRNLPRQASTPIDEPDKIAENRRVEIYSNNEKILEPIFIEKIDRSANPPIVRFKPDAESEAGLKQWGIDAFQENKGSDRFKYSHNSETVKNVDWKLEEMQKIIPREPKPINYSLTLEDKKGNIKKIEDNTLPIKVITVQEKRKEKIGDYEIEKFSLILFDFNSSNIEGSNKKIIDFIKSRTSEDSEIEINGYTDRTGDSEYNQKLSERRAKSTKTALGNNKADYKGVGEDQLLYDNDLPEGRFYCRTVVITVKTRIE